MTVAAPAAPTKPTPPEEPPPPSDRLASAVRHVVLAAVAYVPMLLTARGRVVADTKSYLYLDPGRLLARAPFMWDPNVGLGTVTHQNIGYLFPMGPWFWVFDRLGAPDWVAQRLWVGTLMFAAGAGVMFLARSLGWSAVPSGDRPPPRVLHRLRRRSDDAAAPPSPPAGRLSGIAGAGTAAAAALYMLTPFLLENAARFSVLLMPWSALPWLLGLLQRALRSGRWRHPAWFAIVVTLVGGVNATALLLAGLGPLLWLPFAVWVHREVTLRRALATVARIGALTVGCSLWWIAGLSVQGGYGLDVLAYSETVQAVARTSLSSEVLRGLGYWFFYGGDKVGPWIEPNAAYITSPWLMAVGLAVPVLAIVAAVSIRWRYRAFFVAMVVLGTTVAVGAYPYGSPSPLGAVFKAFATSSTAGLAMRSTARVVPLVVLGLAMLVAAGLAAFGRALPRAAAVATTAVVVLAAAGLPPLWTGRFFGRNLQRAEQVPKYWLDAARYLDERGGGTRVLEIPGSDFASYRWGTTIDPITPGLMDRPYAARELIPYGSGPSADLMIALDAQMQSGQLDPSVLAPVARLMNAGDILLRSDLEYERYRLPRPRALWALLERPPAGLRAPVAFGPPAPNRAIPRLPLRDAIELAIPAGTPDPPPVAVFGVKDPVPIVRAAPTARPLLLAGDGEGVIEAARAQLLAGPAPLFYSAAIGKDAALRRRLMDSGARLVLTDTNRRRGRRWSTLWETSGYTEPAGERPLEHDVSDNRLPVFPGAADDAFTTAEQRGVKRVTASSYGNPVTYIPETRAANALDGDPSTAWRVGDFSAAKGERLRVDLDAPMTADHVELVQPLDGARNRYITRVGVVVDGKDIGTFTLDDRSRRPEGQRVDIGRRRFTRMELVVRGDNIGRRRRYDGISPVGFAEVRLPGVRVDEVIRLPKDLLAGAGTASARHDLSVLLSRQRSDAVDPGRHDEEESMVRAFSLPTARRFTMAGEARLSAFVPEPEIDRLLGIPTLEDGGVTVTSSSYLQGILTTRAAAAFDGDRATAWSPRFGEESQIGAWIEADSPTPRTLDRLDLALVTDGDHSVPTRLRIEGDGQARTVTIPALADKARAGATTAVSVDFAPLTASRVRVVVEDVRRVTNNDYYSEAPTVRPIGIAELGIPGLRRAAPPAQIDGRCRTDLLEVDGRPVGVRLSGSSADAAARSALRVEPCGDGTAGLVLGPGDHLLRAAKGKRTGVDLDDLTLTSAAAPGAATAGGAGAAAPRVDVARDGRTSLDLKVRDADRPFWLVLGQSHNAGWSAKVKGGASLGRSTLVDGYANGWYVDPRGRSDLGIEVSWTPQRRVWAALALSSITFALCLVLALAGWRRRRPAAAMTGAAPGTGPAFPEPTSPFRFDPARGRLRPAPAAVVAVACGLGATVVVSPAVGLLVLAATGIAVGVRGVGRSLLTVGATAATGVTGAYVVVRQVWRGGPPADFTWVTHFYPAHVAAWIALALLAADVVVDLASRRPSDGRSDESAGPT